MRGRAPLDHPPVAQLEHVERLALPRGADLPEASEKHIRLREQPPHVLVDRRWPRGVSKARAELDEWCSRVAPSDMLRKWYRHDPAKFEEFGSRYREELDQPERASALRHLRLMAGHDRLTLLTAAKRLDLSQAAVLAELLRVDNR